MIPRPPFYSLCRTSFIYNGLSQGQAFPSLSLSPSLMSAAVVDSAIPPPYNLQLPVPPTSFAVTFFSVGCGGLESSAGDPRVRRALCANVWLAELPLLAGVSGRLMAGVLAGQWH